MPDFLHSLESLGLWSVDALWLPLAAWTLAALLVLLLDARLPLRRPLVRQRLLVALLVALPLGVALRLVYPLTLPAPTPVALDVFVPPVALPTPSLDAAPVSAPARPIFPLIAGFSVLLMGVAAAGGFAWLVVQQVRLRRWLAGLMVHSDPARAAQAREMVAQTRASAVRVRLVDADVSPFTYGILRPVVVLPARLTDDEEAFRLALTHEAAHVAHGDARWHFAARLAAAFVPWHPLAHRLIRQAELRREQAADAFVLGHFPVARRQYANLLLDFGAVPAPAAALSASIHQLKPRVAAMKTPLDLRARGLVPALVLLLSLTATLSLRAQDTTEVPVDVKVDVEVRPDVYVVVEEMPTLLPNNEVGMENLQASVRYPEMARRAGIEGRVIVQFVVDETGGVQNPEIVRGVGAGLDEEALRAVRTLTFTPGRQRGEAVKVQMTLPVTFRLGTGQPLHDNSSQGEANTLQLKDVRRDGNRLTGQVVSNSNAPVPKASLQIVGTQIGAATNDEGRFTLIGLPTGSFELRISAEGFEPLVTFGQEGDLSPETMSSTTPLPRTTTSLTTPLPRTTLTPMGMMAIPRTMTASEAKELAQATLPQTHPDIGNHIIIFELLDEGKPEVLVSHCPQYNTAAIAEARAMMTRSTQLPQTRTMISVLACPNE